MYHHPAFLHMIQMIVLHLLYHLLHSLTHVVETSATYTCLLLLYTFECIFRHIAIPSHTFHTHLYLLRDGEIRHAFEIEESRDLILIVQHAGMATIRRLRLTHKGKKHDDMEDMNQDEDCGHSDKCVEDVLIYETRSDITAAAYDRGLLCVGCGEDADLLVFQVSKRQKSLHTTGSDQPTEIVNDGTNTSRIGANGSVLRGRERSKAEERDEGLECVVRARLTQEPMCLVRSRQSEEDTRGIIVGLSVLDERHICAMTSGGDAVVIQWEFNGSGMSDGGKVSNAEVKGDQASEADSPAHSNTDRVAASWTVALRRSLPGSTYGLTDLGGGVSIAYSEENSLLLTINREIDSIVAVEADLPTGLTHMAPCTLDATLLSQLIG